MQVDRNRVREFLKSFNFSSLFIEELGWDQFSAPLEITINDQIFSLQGVAEKRQFAVLICEPLPDGSIPVRQTRLKIDRHVTKAHFEHLIIFYDSAKTTQRWQWVKRERGKPPPLSRT